LQVEYIEGKEPRRTQRRRGTFADILRRLDEGRTAVLTFQTPEEAIKAQASIRVSASRLGMKVETYRAADDMSKVCVYKPAGEPSE